MEDNQNRQTPQTEELQEEFDTVTLSLDDGRELECRIITVFTAGEQDYIALLPMEEFDGEEGLIFIYRYFDDTDEPRLDVIDSDEEYDRAAAAFDEWMDAFEDDTIDLDNEL